MPILTAIANEDWRVQRWPGAGDRANTHAAIIGIGAFYSDQLVSQAYAAYKFASKNGMRLRFFYNEGCINEVTGRHLQSIERLMREWEMPFIGRCDKIGFDRTIKSVDLILEPLSFPASVDSLYNVMQEMWGHSDRDLFKAGTCQFQQSELERLYPNYDMMVERYRKIFHEGKEV